MSKLTRTIALCAATALTTGVFATLSNARAEEVHWTDPACFRALRANPPRPADCPVIGRYGTPRPPTPAPSAILRTHRPAEQVMALPGEPEALSFSEPDADPEFLYLPKYDVKAICRGPEGPYLVACIEREQIAYDNLRAGMWQGLTPRGRKRCYLSPGANQATYRWVEACAYGQLGIERNERATTEPPPKFQY
jgi:hypothetical protein